MSKFKAEYCADTQDYMIYWDGLYIGDITPSEAGTLLFSSDGEFIESSALKAIVAFIDQEESNAK